MISKNELLQHWLGHRKLTRKTIVLFPEKELFEFSIGGMRPFSDMLKELSSLSAPGLKELITRQTLPFGQNILLETKDDALRTWDEDTSNIVEYFDQILENHLQEKVKLFGQFENTVQNHILYYIDNEIHHRGQGFVYLRALGIDPPFFWDRF
jgi:uncharacterized damage-inducible protein DinB